MRRTSVGSYSKSLMMNFDRDAAAGSPQLTSHGMPTLSKTMDSFRKKKVYSYEEEEANLRTPSDAEELGQHLEQSQILEDLQEEPDDFDDEVKRDRVALREISDWNQRNQSLQKTPFKTESFSLLESRSNYKVEQQKRREKLNNERDIPQFDTEKKLYPRPQLTNMSPEHRKVMSSNKFQGGTVSLTATLGRQNKDYVVTERRLEDEEKMKENIEFEPKRFEITRESPQEKQQRAYLPLKMSSLCRSSGKSSTFLSSNFNMVTIPPEMARRAKERLHERQQKANLHWEKSPSCRSTGKTSHSNRPKLSDDLMRKGQERALERRLKQAMSPFPQPLKSPYWGTCSNKKFFSAARGSGRGKMNRIEQEHRRMLDFEVEDLEKDEDITTPLMSMEEGDDILRRMSILQPPVLNEKSNYAESASHHQQKRLEEVPNRKTLVNQGNFHVQGVSKISIFDYTNNSSARTSSLKKQDTISKKNINRRKSALPQFGKVSSSKKLAKNRVTREGFQQPSALDKKPNSAENASHDRQRTLEEASNRKALINKSDFHSQGISKINTSPNTNNTNARASSLKKQDTTNKEKIKRRKSAIPQLYKASSSQKLAKNRITREANHSAQKHKPVIKKPQQTSVSKPVFSFRKRVSIGISTSRGKHYRSAKKCLLPKIEITRASTDSSNLETSSDTSITDKLQDDKTPCKELTEKRSKCDATTSPMLSITERSDMLSLLKRFLDDLNHLYQSLNLSEEQERLVKEHTQSSSFQRLKQMLKEKQESCKSIQNVAAEKTVRFHNSSPIEVGHEENASCRSSANNTSDSFQDNSKDLDDKTNSSEADTPTSFDNSDDTDNIFRTPHLPVRVAQTKNITYQDSPFSAMVGDCERPSLAPLTPKTKQQVWDLKEMFKCQLDSLYE
ncbi:uncharacterized protein LOC143027839 isoform X2 [Oratosquilla oratoria]